MGSTANQNSIALDNISESEETVVLMENGLDDNDGFQQAGIPIDYTMPDHPERIGKI